MSPRTFVARSAALLSLAALGLAACESKTVVNTPPPALTIAVSPSSVTLNTAGQKATFVAVVSGGDATTAKTYSWASSNTAVATVDANGVVTAVANGVASITATATADANVKAAGLVTVAIPTQGGGQPVPPTISIQQVMDNGGNVMDITNVAGQANVVLNVDVPAGNTVNAVQVKIDGVVACQQNFNAAGSAQVGVEATNVVTIVCPVNTAKLNANGTPVYANGSHSISAVLVGPNGVTAGFPATQTWVFNNTSNLTVTAAGSKTATDPAGLLWQDGLVTVTVTPNVFASAQLSTITVSMKNGASKTVSVTNNAPVTVTFREDTTVAGGGTQGIEDAAETVTATAITTAGDQFMPLASFQASMRYDNKGPVFTTQPNLTTLAPNGFMNASAAFTTAKFNAVVADGGVDSNTITFQVANAGTTSYTTVTGIADVGEVAGGSKIARLVACDKLGNCTNSSATGSFGIDVTAPPINSVTADTINPAANNAVVVNLGNDNLSGFDLVNGAIFATVVKDSADANGGDVARCVDLGAGALTTIPSNGCAVQQRVPTTITIPAAAGSGYYTITVYAQDLAGNKTASTTKVALIDMVAPVVNITSRGLTNNIPTVSAAIHDNVELKNYQPFGVFAGAVVAGVTNLPMSAPVSVGTWGLPLSANASPTATLPFGSVQAAFGSGTITQLAQVGFTAADMASNSSGLVVQPQIGNGGAVTATDINGSALTPATTPLCKTGTTAACGNTTATSSALSATVTFNALTNTANPIVAVYFYAVNGANAVLLGSSSTAGFGVNTLNQRVFTFSGTATAAQLPVTGANTVFAIGVDANGNGVILGVAGITTL